MKGVTRPDLNFKEIILATFGKKKYVEGRSKSSSEVSGFIFVSPMTKTAFKI